MSRRFGVDISRWVEKAKGNQDAFVREFCAEVSERVVMRSPVDTGAFRGAWQPGLNDTAPEQTQPDPGGGATVARAALVASQMKAGDVFHLTNHMAYGPKLEYGSSAQAPHGMVRITLAEAPQIAQTILAKLK